MSCLKYIGILLLALTLATPADAKTTTYSLKQAVEYALKANPGVEAKLLAMEKAQMDVGVAQSYFWPSVSASMGWNKLKNEGGAGSNEDFSNRNRNHGWRVALNLFAGFQHLNNFQKSLLSVDVEQARHRQAKLELIANIQLQFLHLLKSREDMKTVRDSKKRIVTQLEAAEAFVNEGMAPYLNVLQNEVELSKVTQQEIKVANAIRNAEVTLNKYLGYDSTERVEYRGKLSDFSGVVSLNEKQAIETSLYSRPDLIMAQKSVAVAIKQSHVTAGRYMPTVNVTYDNMQAKKNYSDELYTRNDYGRSYWNLGLNINWELFAGGGTTFALAGDRKLVASLRKEYEDTMHNAKAEVIKALLDIKAAKELIAASRKGVDAAKESYDMASQRYLTHTGTITDLLDAQLKLTQAEEDYSAALMEYQGARTRFFYNIGQENPGLE